MMPRMLIKLERDGEVRYLEWSTIVDAPTTYGLTLEELHEYIREEYGRCGLEGLPTRLRVVGMYGTSIGMRSVQEAIACNRAGENESELTLDEIWDRYVTHRPTEEEEDTDATPTKG